MRVSLESLEKSKGHIAFVTGADGDPVEFYVRDGHIFRCHAAHLAPVMTDGYRCGRWECEDTPERRRYLSSVWGVNFA